MPSHSSVLFAAFYSVTLTLLYNSHPELSNRQNPTTALLFGNLRFLTGVVTGQEFRFLLFYTPGHPCVYKRTQNSRLTTEKRLCGVYFKCSREVDRHSPAHCFSEGLRHTVRVSSQTEVGELTVV